MKTGALAGDDPWGAPTLEFATASPPASYNHLWIPTVQGRSPLWSDFASSPIVVGLRNDKRETLITNLVDAEPDHKTEAPGPTLWPLLFAIATAVTFTAGIFTPWALPGGMVIALVALTGWFWPRPPHKELLEEQP
jgi:cytochrome c oxidase subunit 1